MRTAIVPANSGRRRSRSRSSSALAILIFLIVSNYERWRVGGYFWNKTGLEYTLMWTLGALYFLINGAGPISLDHLMIAQEF